MDKKSEDGNSILRREAETKLQENPPDDVPTEDDKSLIQELQVHQIELEMQNEELRKTQAQLGESSSQYADLYDFAPVGYVTLDEDSLIWEGNLHRRNSWVLKEHVLAIALCLICSRAG